MGGNTRQAAQTYVGCTKDPGQKLVVGDVLHHGANDPPRFLENLVSRPHSVELAQLQGDPVVFSDPERVHGVQA